MAKKNGFDLFSGSALDNYFSAPVVQAPEKPENKAPETEEVSNSSKEEKKAVKTAKKPAKTEEKVAAAPAEVKEEPVQPRKPGRPKKENAVAKRKVTLELEEDLIDNINKILVVAYPAKDKMSLTKVLNECMAQYIEDHSKDLDAYNKLFK